MQDVKALDGSNGLIGGPDSELTWYISVVRNIDLPGLSLGACCAPSSFKTSSSPLTLSADFRFKIASHREMARFKCLPSQSNWREVVTTVGLASS
ncbi:hypothetical protein PSHT_08906 [Puccinia striiformis]|uniref:Uncharacterized protein n=3 Tax=Puccinia striiformis TaxID=27350 RepID=A0A0L0V3K0_9BASI|nr:hypothetical protein H4Q26_014207 [Puccinia striiformis f. sp. tritici PST-130]KNE93873.1 hypothetical protein PSTG_12785 [Puccinia striiformis f. sp. tritici PST-78]POW09092.1 hypothetical protein PSTT_07032 [Puccinia striiformis]POW09918.1 hypothetical protein PSHT_08906 [Puccinia striiformis]